MLAKIRTAGRNVSPDTMETITEASQKTENIT